MRSDIEMRDLSFQRDEEIEKQSEKKTLHTLEETVAIDRFFWSIEALNRLLEAKRTTFESMAEKCEIEKNLVLRIRVSIQIIK